MLARQLIRTFFDRAFFLGSIKNSYQVRFN
jgi:hypothetical protein